MLITDIRLKITKSQENKSLLGVASVQFDNEFIVHDIKLIELTSGKRVVSFPNKKIQKYVVNDEGQYEEKYEYTDIVHPSNKATREYIETELYKVYDTQIAKEVPNE